MLSTPLADDILNTAVTPATFAGPPLIVVGEGLTGADDPRWTPWAQFADDVNAPVIGVNVNEDVGRIDAGLTALSRFWDYARLRPARWSDGRQTVNLLPCGPVVVMQTIGQLNYPAVAAWDLATRWHRVGGRHRYGKAMLAISSEPRPGLFSPPLYYPRPNTGRSGVAELINIWLGTGGAATPNTVATLQTEDLTHPNLSAHVAPYLVPYLILRRPA